MALKGVKVLEFSGLAPGPFCGMILSDFGATVTTIDKIVESPVDCLNEGKTRINMNIRHPKGSYLVHELCKMTDVVLDTYRPGVMEKLGLGPDTLLNENPRLIYARLTGFGQTGPLAKQAGHDINYVGLSGILSMLRHNGSRPTPPINLLADFAGGGLLCAFGICVALLERNRSNKGQVIDASMTEGANYVASWLTRSQHLPIWGRKPGQNVLDGGAYYYNTYETKDGKFMSVGAIEPNFFEEFKLKIGLPDLDQYVDEYTNELNRQKVNEVFLSRTQSEWEAIFENSDACVFPVLDWTVADEHKQNKYRQTFVDKKITNDIVVPSPAPRLSRTPASSGFSNIKKNMFDEILKTFQTIGLDKNDVMKLYKEGVIGLPYKTKL